MKISIWNFFYNIQNEIEKLKFNVYIIKKIIWKM